MGRGVRDDREPPRPPPFPSRRLGRGPAPAHGRDPNGQGDRGRAVRGVRRDGAVHRDRPRAIAVSGQLPRAAPRGRPQHGDAGDGPGDRSAPESAAVRQDALDRVGGRAPAGAVDLRPRPEVGLQAVGPPGAGRHRDRRAGRVRRHPASRAVRDRGSFARDRVRRADRPGLRDGVLSRARARARHRPQRPTDPQRGVPDLLRLPGVLRRELGRADDGSSQADRRVLRRPVRAARARRHRVAHRVGVPGVDPVGDDVQVRGPELPGRDHEPDPAARARRLLHPRRSDRDPGPARTLARVHASRPVPQAPDPRALLQAGRGSGPLRRPRHRFHDLLALHGVLLLADGVRRPGEPPVATGSGDPAPARDPRGVHRRAAAPRSDQAAARGRPRDPRRSGAGSGSGSRPAGGSRRPS